MNGKIAAVAAAGMLLAGQAYAADAALAQISSVKGSVIVSQNGKFVPAANASGLRAGDRVVAKDGQAQLKYADGCVVALKPQGMATITAQSPCASGSGLVTASQGSSAQLGDMSGRQTAAVLFGVGALAIAVVAITNDDDDDEAPVSP